MTSILVAFVVATLVASLAERMGFPLPASEGRMGCVDGLRGYLALSVVAHHFIIWMQVTRFGDPWQAPALPIFNQLGAGAVGLFFMTTGFVFYRRILTGFRKTSWPAVYVTRAFRILPLLVASVVVVTVIAMTRTGETLRRGDLMAFARWVTTWGEPGLAGDPAAGRINAYVLWSLWFEWLFYVFVLPGAAAVMDLIRGRLPSWVVPAALLFAAAASIVVPLQLPLLHYLPLFAAGMLAFEARMRPVWRNWLQGRVAGLIAAIGLLSTLLLFASPLSPAFPAFAFFFICAASGNSFFGLLSTRGALVLGEISFSLYLLHGIVLSLFFTEGHWMTSEMSPTMAIFLLPALAVTAVVISCITYLGLERPAIRLGSRVASRWTQFRIRSQSPEVEVAP